MFRKIILSLLHASLLSTNAIIHVEKQNIRKISPFPSMMSRNMIDSKCLEDTSYFYENMTLPDPFEPSSLYQNCETDTVGRRIVCDLSHKHEEFFSSCQMVGGKLLVVDVEEYCEGYYHIAASNLTHTPRHEFHSLPLCIAQTCKPLQMIKFLNTAMEYGEMEGCRMRFKSKSNFKKSCKEDHPETEFFVESFRDGQRSRKCKWLKKKMIRIKRHCKNGVNPGSSSPTSDGPFKSEYETEFVLPPKDLANEVCPMTCARKNRFIMKKWNGKFSTKSCSWLVRQPKLTRKRYCAKQLFDRDLHSAAIMCPHVCTRCIGP